MQKYASLIHTCNEFIFKKNPVALHKKKEDMQYIDKGKAQKVETMSG
jgi:hypothetical protein